MGKILSRMLKFCLIGKGVHYYVDCSLKLASIIVVYIKLREPIMKLLCYRYVKVAYTKNMLKLAKECATCTYLMIIISKMCFRDS